MRIHISCLLGMCLCCWCACGHEDLIHDLSEREANVLVSRLIAAGIEPRKEREANGNWKLAVEAQSRNRALQVMTRERLLRGVRGSVDQEKGSVFASKEQQRLEVERKTAREVEILLETIPGVLEARARVHIGQSDVRPLQADGQQGSGAVILIVSEDFAASPDRIAALAGGASGLRPSQVQVFIAPSERGES